MSFLRFPLAALLEKDPYRADAAEMFGVDQKDVTPTERRIAKARAYMECYGVQGRARDGSIFRGSVNYQGAITGRFTKDGLEP